MTACFFYESDYSKMFDSTYLGHSGRITQLQRLWFPSAHGEHYHVDEGGLLLMTTTYSVSIQHWFL